MAMSHLPGPPSGALGEPRDSCAPRWHCALPVVQKVDFLVQSSVDFGGAEGVCHGCVGLAMAAGMQTKARRSAERAMVLYWGDCSADAI